MILICMLPATILAGNKSICGMDDRVPSQDPKVARALHSENARSGCTATMISKTCAISVGHCKRDLNILEFNTKESSKDGLGRASTNNTYYVNQDSLVYSNNGPGNDWAVMEVEKHSTTDLYAGEAQGYYDIATELPEVGSFVKITGYGVDDEVEKSFAQQTTIGQIKQIGGNLHRVEIKGLIAHQVDTMGGNSGSSIINVKTQEIIGVHSHGGCSLEYFSANTNKGTTVLGNPEFNQAIKSCLDKEKSKLEK